jgi:hypothetical protein
MHNANALPSMIAESSQVNSRVQPRVTQGAC